MIQARLLLMSKQVAESNPLRKVRPLTVGRERVLHHWSTVVRFGAPAVGVRDTTLNMSERRFYMAEKR
jgi:hypothetical protein